VRFQDAKLQQLLVDYQNTALTAQQQVDDAISLFLQSGVQVDFLRESARAAREAFRIAMEQYEGGAIDFTPVLISEQNLFQAETSLAVAMGNVPLGAIAEPSGAGGK
jgi:outer membrane protein TolC